MTAKDILLTEMLCAAIFNRQFPIDKAKVDAIDWDEIYKAARIHQIHTLIYPVIKDIDSKIGLDEKLMAVWNISVMSCGIQMICGEVWLGEVIEALEAVEVNTIVLKGMAINKCYPKPELRTMGDADLLVHEEDIEKATEALEGLGYFSSKDKKTKHIEFFKENAIAIELHRLLIDYDFMQNKESFHDEIWEHTKLVNLGSIKANILSWEMQILHICIHMATHISYGGIGLRQLSDLVMVVNAKGNEINWNIVQDRSIKYGIDNFISAIFLVCNRLFNIHIPEEIAIKNVDEEKIEILIKDILSGGNLGNKDAQRASANVLLTNSKDSDDLNSKSKLSRARHILFPSLKVMVNRKRYIYLRKSRILLPFAWVHRIFYGFKRKDFKFSDKKALFQDNELNLMARERNNLLEWLGLR